ncbi:MAG: hypothetical protein ACQETO_09475 [Pseudomonadota bacterium]
MTDTEKLPPNTLYIEVSGSGLPEVDDLPPTDRPWNVYKMGVAPAPEVVIHDHDPG